MDSLHNKPKQKPVALREFVERVAKQKPEKPDYWSSCGQCERNINDAEGVLEATPPQRKPLTDEEIDKAMAENKQKLFDTADNYIKMRRAYARIIEAAHGIKGEA